MIVGTMSPEELWQEALLDQASLTNKAMGLLRALQRRERKSRASKGATMQHAFITWNSPRGNAWYIAAVHHKHMQAVHGLVHWIGAEGKPWAARVSGDSLTMLTPHFISRLGERHDPEPDPRTRLWNLWTAIPELPAVAMGIYRDGHEVVGLITPGGLGLGHRPTPGITVIKTFVDRNLLRPGQRQFLDQLAAETMAIRRAALPAIHQRLAQLQLELSEDQLDLF